MNEILRKIRSQIGILFIVSLSGILVVNILCDCGIVEYGKNYVSTHSENDLIEHDHNYASEQYGDRHTHHENSIICSYHTNCDGSHNDTDTCCEDLTQSIFDNLVKPKLVTFNLDFQPFILYPLFSSYRSTFILSENTYTYVREVANPHPLSGKDIRISIQSFRN